MSFVVRKKISLSTLGEGWEEAYVFMTPFTFAENSQLLELSKVSEDPESLSQVTKDIGDLVASHFLEGKGFDGTKLINITKGNLTDLPIEFYSLVMSQMQGQNIPKNS